MISPLTDPVSLIRDQWPADHLPTAESVASAASAIAELWRYLAHATQHRAVADDVTTLAQITGSLADAESSAAQVLRQLAVAVDRAAEREDVLHDRPGDAGQAAAVGDAASTASTALEEAEGATEDAHLALEVAHTQLAHLRLNGAGDE